MISKSYFLVFLIVFIIKIRLSLGCYEEERSARLQLKLFFDDPLSLRDWIDDGSDCCHWDSVHCNSSTNRVTELDLSYSRKGDSREWYLNASLFLPFQQLQWLSLENNKIGGCVENEGFDKLSTLTNLEYLYLYYNNFNMSILSSLSKLPFLKVLDLSSNKEMGGNLSNQDAKFNHTSLLSSLSKFSSLEYLYIEDIGLKGSIDFSSLFDSLPNLTYLDVGNNQINKFVVRKGKAWKLQYLSLRNVSIHDGKAFSQFLQSFPSLTSLDISYNNLTEMMSGGGFCETGNLQALDLSYNNLTGDLPHCFANLTSLKSLYISSNKLFGNIFMSPLMSLTSIETVDLSNNGFQIPISLEPFFNHSKLKSLMCRNNHLYAEAEMHSQTPKFQLNSLVLSGCKGHCIFPKFLYHQNDLRVVDLSHNNLTGEFPNWLLENNTNLVNLALANNSLTGTFPLPIHHHEILMTLDISMNMFNGHIPVELGAYFPNLIILNMSRNAFEGSIPSSIGDMTLLEGLDLSNNRLSGDVPQHLVEGCVILELLILSNNSLGGEIFSKNFSLKHLSSLQLEGNYFSGRIPDGLANALNLQGLYLSDNNFTGQVPNWFGKMLLLTEFIMSNNSLEGPLPQEFCQLQNLQVLNLERNGISSIPSCFGPLSLKQIHLSRNSIQGQLEHYSFGNCSFLVTLDLGYNGISGSIPNWIGKLSNLTYLILNNNNLQGNVSTELCRLDRLRLIDLSHNKFSGHIPSCLKVALSDNVLDSSAYGGYSTVSNYTADPLMRKEEEVEFRTKTMSYFYHGKILKDMFGIDLSCNYLTGEIPYQFGNLTKIRALNLSHNKLTGSIPSMISDLKQMESLDLSYNKLSGRIPPQLAELTTLAVFSVAHNNLSGRTLGTAAQFLTFNASSYEGNPFLCGFPLPECESEPPPLSESEEEEDDGFMDMEIFYITFGVTYTIVLLGIFAVLLINPHWRRRWFYFVETFTLCVYYFIIDHLSCRFRM